MTLKDLVNIYVYIHVNIFVRAVVRRPDTARCPCGRGIARWPLRALAPRVLCVRGVSRGAVRPRLLLAGGAPLLRPAPCAAAQAALRRLRRGLLRGFLHLF